MRAWPPLVLLPLIFMLAFKKSRVIKTRGKTEALQLLVSTVCFQLWQPVLRQVASQRPIPDSGCAEEETTATSPAARARARQR
jgi:hypothetical protein